MQVKDLQLKKAFRFVLMALLISMSNLNSYAERVDPATAQRVAATFLNNNGVRSNQLTNISERAGFPNLYIFNSEQGFVILAADDCVKPILGYSLTGRFMAENMPANLRWWLQGYNDEIQYIIDNQLCAPTEIAQEWEELTRGRFDVAIRTAVVEPLITTKWDQDYPFNYYCPEILGGPGGHCYAGCVATAMAQIVRYHQHPEVGVGSHSYTWNGQTLSAIFGATIYSYSDMPDTINSVNYDIAGLIYDCGISVDMDYDYDVSSADAVDAVDALQNYFDYGICEFKFKSEYQEEWMDMVKTELNHDRPLLYYGKGDESIGHAFVCDGYDSYGFHFNWGWGGKCDGYYPLELLQPWYLGPNNNLVPQGNYTNIQGAIFGIQPSEHSCDAPNMLSGSINGRTVTFTWEAVPNVDSYSVYCNGTMIEPAFTGTTYTSNNLEIGLYHFYVRSNCSDGSKSASSYIAQFEIEYQGDVAATIGDLRYSLNELTLTAEVIGHKDGLSASGSLNIPSSVTYTNQYGQTHTYTITSIGNYAFNGCSGFSGSLIIPNSVTTIGDSAFNGCSGFTGSLTIPNSVTTIEHWAFHGCSFDGLNIDMVVIPQTDLGFLYDIGGSYTGSLTIGNSVTTIRKGAFENCSGFTGNLTIGNSVRSIGESAFEDCSSFTGNLIIPNSVTSIGNYAFYGCNGFTGNLAIGNSVASIGKYAFKGCNGLSGSLTIPNSLTSIGVFAFSDCSFNGLFINMTNIPNNFLSNVGGNYSGTLTIGNSVTTIGSVALRGSFTGDLTIPNSVISIGSSAFNGCSGFTGNLTIGNSVTMIGSSAFYGCSGFTGDLIIPNSVNTIGNSAFYNCNGFTSSLTIPNSVTSIGDYAFSGCSGFTGNLTIPNTVVSIGRNAFNGCSFNGLNIDMINIPSVSSSYGFLHYIGGSFAGVLTIGNSVVSIGDYAFRDYSGFTGSLSIGNSVTSIGNGAFYGCSGFTGSLTFPNSVTTIGNSAFSGCSGFTGNLTIPNSVTTIGNNAFYSCSGFTGSLTIPELVTSIGSSAFFGCNGLSGNLTIGNSVVSIGNYAFSSCLFTGSLIIPDSVTTIGDNAFENCTGFTGSLAIGNSVTTIGYHAFYNCNGFTGDLIIPNSVTVIGIGAFTNCTGFTGDLTIGNSVAEIQGRQNYYSYDGAFEGCVGFAGTLTIPSSLEIIGTQAFKNCSGFTTVYYDAANCADSLYGSESPFYGCGGNLIIGDNVERIPDKMFSCAAFTGSLTISNSVTAIGNDAFSGCSGFIGNLVIGSSVTTIGEGAFSYCDGFTGDLTIPNSVTTIGRLAFSSCDGFTGSLTIGNSVTTISNSAFSGCSGFTGSLTIGNSVTTIGESAFLNCSGITGELVIPSAVAFIGWGAFQYCSGFTGTLTIPASVTTIEANAFSGCSGLSQIVVDDDNSVYDSRDNCNAIIQTDNNELVAGCKNTVIPNSVTSIGRAAFASCSGLTSILIPNSVTTLGMHAFAGSGIKEVTIGHSVESIGLYAFNNCDRLAIMHILAETPPVLVGSTFEHVSHGIPVSVPCGATSNYQEANGWSEFSNYYEGEYYLTVTVSSEFCGNASITQNGYCEGGEYIVIANPYVGNVFSRWTCEGETVSTEREYHFELADNMTLVAEFQTLPNHHFFIGGSTTNHWDDPENWNPAVVPSESETIGICADAELNVDANITALAVLNDNVLTIHSGKTLTVIELESSNPSSVVVEEGGQVFHANEGVFATVKKIITPYTQGCNDGWHLIASPVVDSIPIVNVQSILSSSYDMYRYDEPSHYWKNYKAAENDFNSFEAGNGYLYANSGRGITYNYGFGDGGLDGWTLIDADGDGYNWYSNYGYICSASWISNVGPLTPDNYIVSPQVNFTTSSKISFRARAQDANYAADHFGVAISTTVNTSSADFITIDEWTMTAKSGRDSGRWYQFTVNLGQFAGQTGYVALRHFDCSDQYILLVDDVVIEGIDNGEPQNVTLSFAGELENGSATINLPLSYTESAGNLKGFNLVGNPFVHNVTSYAVTNVAEGCFRMNEAKDNFIVSEISETMPLKPAEAFFVKATAEGASITFNPGRSRGETEKKGFVNLELNRDGKLIDRLIVKREGEPLEKLSLKENGTRIFATNGNQEMAVVVAEGNEQPINFKAEKNGAYTINVNVEGLDLDYLHLIDNLTGADIDLLVEQDYIFEAKTTDYDSRFKLVFSVSGDENDEDAPFAFINNGNIIIVGAEADATLQIVDVLGHVIHSGDAMNRISTNGMSPGVYVLRLINGDDVRVQKIVIR